MWNKIRTLGFTLSILSVLVLLASGLGNRFGVWGFRTGLMLFLAAGGIGFAAAIISVVFLVGARLQASRRDVIRAIAGVALGLASLTVVMHWKSVASSVPRINDITTDTEHPPQFIAILPFRTGGVNSAVYGGPSIAAQQRRAYPDIRTKILNVPTSRAFQEASEAARKMCWKTVTSDPKTGRIEATATTFWFGFKDDIVVRITPEGDKSRVDVRSASRVGLSDIGTNAKRIRIFLRLMNG
ncbi:MAG: DUF1499 domain-containing protein [Nitrospinae bacterium]|nr:DUF1499 domain-containing protein [Nitrospinota bacterium]